MVSLSRLFSPKTSRVLAACLLVGVHTSQCVSAELDRASEEETIRIAFLRSQLSTMPASYTYFICIGNSPPSDAIMSALSAIPAGVQKCSESYAADKRKLEAENSANLVFQMTLGKIKWISDVEVEFYMTSYLGPLHSSGSTFTMKRIDGMWQVTTSFRNIIS